MYLFSTGRLGGVSSFSGGISEAEKKRSFYLPIVPRRCDHFRIRMTGSGGCRLYSLVREVYTGSEL